MNEHYASLGFPFVSEEEYDKKVIEFGGKYECIVCLDVFSV